MGKRSRADLRKWVSFTGGTKNISKSMRQTTFLWFSVRRRSILQDQASVSEARLDTQKKTPAIPVPAQKGAATGPWSKAALFSLFFRCCFRSGRKETEEGGRDYDDDEVYPG